MAATYARLGEKDQAFACLEKTYAERSPMLMAIESRPDLDSLRADPRFADLLRRAGFDQ